MGHAVGALTDNRVMSSPLAPTMPSSLPPVPDSAEALNGLTTTMWEAVMAAPAADAAKWMAATAKLGHAGAQAVMGQWSLDGHGVAKDANQALVWFLHAAQQGHPMGMNMAGRCHEQGWGTEVDPDKAAHWYRKAIDKDLPEARYNLANLLASGTGMAQDHAQALTLYQRAAEQGYAKAFAKLGRYHEDGLLLDKDLAMAFLCYQRGAEGGDFRGQFSYAGMLAGQGRHAEALEWLTKVPLTATPRYLKQAGELLVQSPDPAFRDIGEQMLARVAQA
jgi:TPR repeat protein